MLDKTILVFYINVGNASHQEVDEIVSNIRKTIKANKEDEEKIMHYIIPVRDQETKIECLNSPLYISDERMKEDIINKMKIIDNRLDRITSSLNAEYESRNVLTEKYN